MDAWGLGTLANFLLGLSLLALAVLAWGGGDGGRFLGAFLALVGVNYVVDASQQTFAIVGVPLGTLWYVAYLTNFLDPAFLVLFALARTGRPPGKALVAALLLPGALLTVRHVAGWSEWTLPSAAALVLMMGVGYSAALLLLTRAAFRGGPDRDELETLVLALAPVVLARLPLAYIDLGFLRGPMERAEPRSLVMEAMLVAAALAFAAYCLRVAGPSGRTRARTLLRSVLGLLVVVEVVWALRFLHATPAALAAFPFLYSIRWFLFLAVVASHAAWGRTAAVPHGFARPARRAVVVLFGILATTGVAAFVYGALPLEPLPSLAVGAAVVLVAAGALRALRAATTPPEAAAGTREAALYRARALHGASDAELEELARTLGLGRAQAARIRALAALEREAGDGGATLAEGALVSGTYRIDGLHGAGAFGRVFRATDVRTGAGVLVKELREEWQADPLALARFRNETEALLAVSHPNLVRFLAVEPTRGGSVLVLERVEGETLQARLAAGPLPEAEARRLARDVLLALSALHERGIVHRDVKPANVMRARDGRFVLLDLGSATPPGSGTVLGAAEGTAMPGTPAYMSPEQRAGRRVDATSDLYALGLVLREALPPDAAPRWAAVLDRATCAEPAARWPSAAAFLRALP